VSIPEKTRVVSETVGTQKHDLGSRAWHYDVLGLSTTIGSWSEAQSLGFHTPLTTGYSKKTQYRPVACRQTDRWPLHIRCSLIASGGKNFVRNGLAYPLAKYAEPAWGLHSKFSITHSGSAHFNVVRIDRLKLHDETSLFFNPCNVVCLVSVFVYDVMSRAHWSATVVNDQLIRWLMCGLYLCW